MFLLITRNGDTRRIQVPDAVERMSDALAAFAANPPQDAWDGAERVSPHWPHEAPPIPTVAEPVVTIELPGAPDTLTDDTE